MNGEESASTPLVATPRPAAVPEQPYVERFQRQAVTGAACLLILVALIYLAERFAVVLQQLLVAVFLLYIILPAHRYLTHRRIPPLLAFAVMVTVAVLLVFALGVMVSNSLADLQTRLPQYRDSLQAKLVRLERISPALRLEGLQQLLQNNQLSPEDNARLLRTVFTFLSGALLQVAVVLVYLLFLLAELTSFQRRIQKAVLPGNVQHVQDIINRINSDISRYLVVKTFVSLVTGSLTWLALTLIGVDYAVLWGIVAFLFNYIPYVGSVAAVIFPILLAAVQFEHMGTVALVAVVLLVVQNGVAYGVEPWLTGRSLDMSPLVVILALAFWGALWGIVGMLLAVPLVVVIKTILENIPATRPIATLLSNG